MSAMRRSRPLAGFETRPWGGFQTIEEGRGYKVKRLLVQPGQRLSLQRHRHRAEHWVVVTGSPAVIISGRRRRLRARRRGPRGESARSARASARSQLADST